MQCGRPGFSPRVRKIPWRRERLPSPVFWPGEFHERYSPWGHQESDTTEWLSFSSFRESHCDHVDQFAYLQIQYSPKCGIVESKDTCVCDRSCQIALHPTGFTPGQSLAGCEKTYSRTALPTVYYQSLGFCPFSRLKKRFNLCSSNLHFFLWMN